MDAIDLPASIPVFPLSGVLLLPRGRIPLNVFEPRYRNMMQDSLSGDGVIGMVQPVSPEEVPVTPEGRIKNLDGERLALYSTGCAGRIVSHEESPDGRFLIVLEGLNRFKIGEEIETTRGYRRFESNWSAYPADQSEDRETLMDRAKLLAAMEKYFASQNLRADWSAIDDADNDRLVTALAMSSPFAAAEKQALLEAEDLAARCSILTTIAEMAAHDAKNTGHRPQ
ncbi:MAG: LON peptidase substrate-binding domain-containing protein [Pseudomonadota bacterium]|nr:LON peptidase substrate-binding domain-containing protein [Pseudomonadota bacterium]